MEDKENYTRAEVEKFCAESYNLGYYTRQLTGSASKSNTDAKNLYDRVMSFISTIPRNIRGRRLNEALSDELNTLRHKFNFFEKYFNEVVDKKEE